MNLLGFCRTFLYTVCPYSQKDRHHARRCIDSPLIPCSSAPRITRWCMKVVFRFDGIVMAGGISCGRMGGRSRLRRLPRKIGRETMTCHLPRNVSDKIARRIG
jgi:hypothetical protein